MKFTFIKQQNRFYPIALLCKVLRVSRSGYYAWRKRPMSSAAQRRKALAQAIQKAHEESNGTYGSPRIHRVLLSRGIRCCKNTVAKIMRQIQVFSKMPRKFKPCTTESKHNLAVPDNILNRSFHQPKPNQAWVSDITYVPTAEGFLYLAVVLDVCSRKVIGWSMCDHLRSELTCDALSMAIERCKPNVGVLHHSDRGVQYASLEYQQLLHDYKMVCSMSRQGNCWDNAVAESFFGTLKTELTHHERYATRGEAKASVFEYIECFYNPVRLHSALNYLSPDEYERRLIA